MSDWHEVHFGKTSAKWPARWGTVGRDLAAELAAVRAAIAKQSAATRHNLAGRFRCDDPHDEMLPDGRGLI